MLRTFALILALGIPTVAHAVEPDEMLDDPALEARAREISKGLRCVVCLNQNIDSSNAGVARDLRLLVRERLVAGDSDEAAMSFIQARYGDYVLLKPPLNKKTYVLWIAPPAMAVIAFGIGVISLRPRRKKFVPDALTESEERQLAGFLETHKAGDNT